MITFKSGVIKVAINFCATYRIVLAANVTCGLSDGDQIQIVGNIAESIYASYICYLVRAARYNICT